MHEFSLLGKTKERPEGNCKYIITYNLQNVKFRKR
jgi:hypothetical protein